jgi:hypothetical protein
LIISGTHHFLLNQELIPMFGFAGIEFGFLLGRQDTFDILIAIAQSGPSCQDGLVMDVG